MNKIVLRWILSISIFFALGDVAAITPVSIKQETANYIIDIKYPQGFSAPSIDVAIKEFIADTQKSFLNELSEDEDTPADAPGKTGLNVLYSIPYDAKNALSVRFEVSIYHRGAAHPLNNVNVLNFINGEQTSLAALFLSKVDYLHPLARFCAKVISKRGISDSRWINEGTKPTADNYSVWYFSDKGINVVFGTYQVAAYVYGPIDVAVPITLLAPLVKPELLKMLWITN